VPLLAGEPAGRPAPAAGAGKGQEPAGKKEEGPDARGTGGYAELEVSPEAATAIRRALDFLATQQAKDGSFTGQGTQYRAAMTGLAGLAFLSAGHTAGRGKHAKVVEKAIESLLKIQDKEGCYADDTAGGRSMHGHGYALHFMAEAYGMTDNPDLARKLRKSVTEGVRLTARCQATEGGWYYQPESSNQHEGSITVTQVQALWAARQAGINVPQKTIDKGIGYMKKSQQPDGGICYRLGMPGSRPALSAAGVMVFCGLGQRESRESAKAIGYMRKNITGVKGRGMIGMGSGFDHYATFYLGQALYQAGDPDWSQHYPKLRDEILKQQNKSTGGWDSNYGPVFGTACYTLVLAIPYQYLPTFQR
jgi:hypothetical protein